MKSSNKTFIISLQSIFHRLLLRGLNNSNLSGPTGFYLFDISWEYIDKLVQLEFYF